MSDPLCVHDVTTCTPSHVQPEGRSQWAGCVYGHSEQATYSVLLEDNTETAECSAPLNKIILLFM